MKIKLQNGKVVTKKTFSPMTGLGIKSVTFDKSDAESLLKLSPALVKDWLFVDILSRF